MTANATPAARQEFACVVVSVTSDRCDNAFARDPQRLNVACSRSKARLVVVGHAAHFTGSGAWGFLNEPARPRAAPPGLAEPAGAAAPGARLGPGVMRAWAAPGGAWADMED